jgi:hypothetical protein
MKEQLINFETAKLAKLKGFNVYVEHMQTYFSHEMWDKYLYPNSDIGDFQYSETAKRTKDIGFALNENYPVPFYEPYYMCPTQSFLQKWLREVHGIQVYVYSHTKNGKGEYRDYVAYVNETAINDARDEDFQSYEEALEAGLVKALNMIKI